MRHPNPTLDIEIHSSFGATHLDLDSPCTSCSCVIQEEHKEENDAQGETAAHIDTIHPIFL